MIKNPAFYFNSELCTGCKACMIACIDKHNLNKGVLWRRVLEYSGGEWLPVGDAYEQNVFAYYVSLSCNHCENPVCAEACPTQAMHKDENGIVSVDPDRCVGCRYCEWNCPYGAPQDGGRPCRALDYGEYDELLKRYGEQAAIAPLPGPELTRPHFICAPNRHSKPQGSTEGLRGKRISNPEEV